MISWLIRLLAQASCGYCGKPLHQLEERRFGKVSLCKDCFATLTAPKTANSMVNNIAVKTASKMATKTAHKWESKERDTGFTIVATKRGNKPFTILLAIWQKIGGSKRG